MKLTVEQMQEIYKNGFVRLPGVVPQKNVQVALRAINFSVGQGMDRKEMPEFRSRSYCPELLGKPPILDLLYETPLYSLAESAADSGLKLAGGGQIALRFPVMEHPGTMAPHIDGLYSPNNGVRKGTIFTFTMLAGIFLSDVPNHYWGNFVVWPGSHKLYESYFQQHGPDILRKQMPDVTLPEPHQVLANPGDAILCHYQLGHTVAINVSPYVRYAVFFRLTHPDHRKNIPLVFTDMWREWPRLRSERSRSSSSIQNKEQGSLRSPKLNSGSISE